MKRRKRKPKPRIAQLTIAPFIALKHAERMICAPDFAEELVEEFQHWLRTYGSICIVCRKLVRKLETDHLLSLKNNGPNDIVNIIWMCHKCHVKKGSMLPSVWLASIDASVQLRELVADRCRHLPPC